MFIQKVGWIKTAPKQKKPDFTQAFFLNNGHWCGRILLELRRWCPLLNI